MTQFSQQDLFGGPRPPGVSDPRGSPAVPASTTPRAQGEEQDSGANAPPDRGLCQPREPDTWHRALTRRLRTLVRIAPLHRVEATKGLRDEDLSAQDLRALGLRAVDSIIEEMGLGGGATRADEERLLAELILAAEPKASPERVQLVTKVVLDALLNERERRQAFREQYTDYDQETPTKRVLAFHLLREQEQEDGSVVMKATTEAINLYAGMLEYDVEDAQAAEEAVLESQVRRGRIAEAVETARRARLRSLEFEQKLLRILKTTRRDVRQIDWLREVIGLLGEARAHLEDRLATERRLIDDIEGRLESVADADGAQLAVLRDTLEECVDRHLRLHRHLISANQAYLDEQERQIFRPRAFSALPDLEAEVLRSALSLPVSLMAEASEALIACFHAPRAPRLVSLATLLGKLLAPRRQIHEERYEVTEPELDLLETLKSAFSEADFDCVDALLRRLDEGPTRLSCLLAQAGELAIPRRVQHLLVLRALLAYDPSAADPQLIAEAANQPLPVRELGFSGDDLVLMRPPARAADVTTSESMVSGANRDPGGIS